MTAPDDPTLTLHAHPAASTLSPQAPPTRGRRFWLRSFALTVLLVLLMLVGFTALGVYQGMNDREVKNKVAAIEAFEQGKGLMNEGKYELALAYFREALRLEPDFEAAAQFMEVAQREADTVSALPTQTPLPTGPDSEGLFAQATEALAREEWESAANTLDALSSQAPTFRPQEVTAALFQARMELGRTALAAVDLEEAQRHFDLALAISPEDATALQLRRVASAYRSGLDAYEGQQWEVAAEQLRIVYLIDPDLLNTEALLAKAHFELGDQFAAAGVWCEAAQQYRSSLGVQPSSQVATLAQQSDAQCARQARAPRTATPVSRSTPQATATRTPTRSPTLSPTTAVPTIAASATPVASRSPTTPPATPAGFAYSLVGNVGESFDASCGGGHYIRGTVTAADGTPLPDVALLLVDEFGNSATVTTKRDPLGQYNFPISANAIRYQVTVTAGGQRLSSAVTVDHSERFAQAPQACHILNWRKSF